MVAIQVWVKVGSADELSDQAGLAHLHEHMLFKGTARRGPGEIAREIEACGGEINAWTSFDQTVYHVVLASRFFAQGIDVLADAVTSAAFDPAELTREIEVVCEEIKRSQDSPTRKLSREIPIVLYGTGYWNELVNFEAMVRHGVVDRRDLELFRFADRPAEALELLRTALAPAPEAETPAFARSSTPEHQAKRGMP